MMKRREKTLVFFVIIALAVWAFDRFYYTPQKKDILRLREDVKAAELKLNESIIFTKGVEVLETEVSRLETEFRQFSEQPFRGEELKVFLRHLARDSERLRIKVVSLNSQEEKRTLPDERGASAFQYRRIRIQMVLQSDYHALCAYLQGIRNLPFTITVDQLQVERKEEASPLLRVTMKLMVHVIA